MVRKWCDRCNKYHDGEPVDPHAIIESHANDMKDAIDKEVFDQIMRKAMIETAQKVQILERNILMMREEMDELNKKRS